MITESDMEAAFEAGFQLATREQWAATNISPEHRNSFRNWRRWYYRCQDCGQDLLGTHVHQCPARLSSNPYREKGTTP